MDYKELAANVGNMFPQDRGESAEHYAFFITQALEPFKNRPGDLSGAWDAIRRYDGHKNRPGFGFFIGIASGVRDTSETFTYFVCRCGLKLSASTAGGCPVCHSVGARMVITNKPVHTLRAQSPCFSCSIYSDKATGPTCDDFGTPKYTTCSHRSECKCVLCCRFEYLRVYEPSELKRDGIESMKRLPAPTDAPGLAFHDGRAAIDDINEFLCRVIKKKEA